MEGVSEGDIIMSTAASIPVVAPRAVGSTPESEATGVVIALESEAGGIAIALETEAAGVTIAFAEDSLVISVEFLSGWMYLGYSG